MSNLEKYSDKELLDMFDADIEAEIRSRGYKFGWFKEKSYAGEIYILVNPAFPDLVKIGYADNAEKRVKSLNRNSGLPDPYHIYATYRVKKRLEDLRLHSLIDSLDSSLRHSKNREFYEMSPEKAFGILSAIAQISGDEDQLVLNPMGDRFFDGAKQEPLQQRKQKSRMSFSLLGIGIGEKVQFVDDKSVEAVVNSDTTVEFEGNTWKLSPLTRMLKERMGSVNSSGSYQGGMYFLYKGKRLTDIRKEIEDEQD